MAKAPCKARGCTGSTSRPAFLCVVHWIATPKSARGELEAAYPRRRGDGGRYARARRAVLVEHNGHDCPRCGVKCRLLLPICPDCSRGLRGGDRAARGELRRINAAWRPVRVKAYQPEPGNPWAAYDACRAAVAALVGELDVQF